MTPTEVITAALSGDLDDGIDGIIAACTERRTILSRSVFHTLTVGDRVQIVEGRPQYVQGAVGVVVRKTSTKVVIDLDERHGRFQKSVVVTPSMLKKL